MQLRRTLLFIPGNSPNMLQNGMVFGSDSVIFDLEDAVAPTEKDAARNLVGNTLKYVNYQQCEKIVRINPLETFAEQDIAHIVPCRPDVLLIPKTQSPADIHQIVAFVEKAEKATQKPIKLIPLIETARGIAEAYAIAKSHPRIVAMAFGAEDYTANIGVQRTQGGNEIFTARSLIVNAAAAANIQALDTPYTDVQNEAGLLADTQFALQQGFDGKLVINPRQIDVIHSAFMPDENQIYWAERVIEAIEQAEREGIGVISLDGKMIDAPIVLRARKILLMATLGNGRGMKYEK